MEISQHVRKCLWKSQLVSIATLWGFFFPVCGHIGPEGHKTPGLLIFPRPIIHPSIFYTCLSCLKGVKPLPAHTGHRVNLDTSHTDRETLTFTLTGRLVFSSPPPRVVDWHLLLLLSTAVRQVTFKNHHVLLMKKKLHPFINSKLWKKYSDLLLEE